MCRFLSCDNWNKLRGNSRTLLSNRIRLEKGPPKWPCCSQGQRGFDWKMLLLISLIHYFTLTSFLELVIVVKCWLDLKLLPSICLSCNFSVWSSHTWRWSFLKTEIGTLILPEKQLRKKMPFGNQGQKSRHWGCTKITAFHHTSTWNTNITWILTPDCVWVKAILYGASISSRIALIPCIQFMKNQRELMFCFCTFEFSRAFTLHSDVVVAPLAATLSREFSNLLV